MTKEPESPAVSSPEADVRLEAERVRLVYGQQLEERLGSQQPPDEPEPSRTRD